MGAVYFSVLLQQLRVLQQIFLELGEGSVAVADGVLHVLVQLGVGLVKSRGFEHGIPAKVGGATSGDNFALHATKWIRQELRRNSKLYERSHTSVRPSKVMGSCSGPREKEKTQRAYADLSS